MQYSDGVREFALEPGPWRFSGGRDRLQDSWNGWTDEMDTEVRDQYEKSDNNRGQWSVGACC